MSRFHPLGLAFVLAACTVSAHETLPADWCPEGTHPVVVGEFSFTAAELIAYRAAHSGYATGTGDACTPKTCGIVDDWFSAQEMASSHCGGVGLRRATAEDAVAFVYSPASFQHPDHHDRFRFAQGPLVGACVVCRPTSLPAEPPPKTR